MDSEETGQLDDIHTEVKSSHARLGAINERTKNIQESIEDISEDVQANQEDINELQGKVRRNTVIINGVTVGLGSFVIWVSDKLTRLKPF